MSMFKVAVSRYEHQSDSVRNAVDLAGGLAGVSAGSKVFIKPNIVFWTKSVNFPKWGVVTTSRVVEDMVILLKEHGVQDITIGEGTVVFDPKDTETQQHAYESLGYNKLADRYGVKLVSVFERPFEKVSLGDGIELKFNADIMSSDLVIDLPVLKTHAQTVVSLGIKNLKGTIDISSRKKCHSADPDHDLHAMVARLADNMPPIFTLIDGIYTIERGPGFDGKARLSNLLVASQDVLSADKVGAAILGYKVSEVPYLMHACKRYNRPADLSDIEVTGESVETVASRHEHTFPYNEDNTLPLPMEKAGIQGISYPKYDLTMCTYCSYLTGAILASISFAWKGEPWDDVEILTGKVMNPTPGKKTILLGKCLYQAHKSRPDIDTMIAVKTCPPSPDAIVEALHQVGIDINPYVLQNLDQAPAYFNRKYEGKPEFDESFFRIE
jgi:uncharacterized protein (DUF362 family)